MKTYREALKELLQLEGSTTLLDLAKQAEIEGAVPCICMNDGCDNTAAYEPDCTDGYCEICETNTMKSLYILGGLI